MEEGLRIMEIVPISGRNRERAARFLRERWFSTDMAVHGESIDAAALPGFAAEEGDRIAGLVTYRVSGDVCEIVSLDSTEENRGTGTALLEKAAREALRAGCGKLVLTTTNDNMNALRFYQKRGFDLVRIRRNALRESRKLKPSIPETGNDGIPLRHEIDLERILTDPWGQERDG